MQQGITKGDALPRIGGISFIVGAVLLTVFNILLPRVSDPTDMKAFIQSVADTNGGFWELGHILLGFGIWGVAIGVVGIYRSITTGGAAAWARLGFYGVLAVSIMWTVLFALEGLGLAAVVGTWEMAPGADKASLFLIASSLSQVNVGLFSMTIIGYWFVLTMLGIGMALSAVYPKWMGWALIVLGVVTVAAVGFPQALTGITQTSQLLFMVLSLLTTVWALVVGIWLTRKAW
jgi:hypothetical protein